MTTTNLQNKRIKNVFWIVIYAVCFMGGVQVLSIVGDWFVNLVNGFDTRYLKIVIGFLMIENGVFVAYIGSKFSKDKSSIRTVILLIVIGVFMYFGFRLAAESFGH